MNPKTHICGPSSIEGSENLPTFQKYILEEVTELDIGRTLKAGTNRYDIFKKFQKNNFKEYTVAPENGIRRQSTKRKRSKKKQQQKPVSENEIAQNVYQMLMLILIILAFGTFLMTITMQYMKHKAPRTNRDKPLKRIVILKPKPEPYTMITIFIKIFSTFANYFMDYFSKLFEEY